MRVPLPGLAAYPVPWEAGGAEKASECSFFPGPFPPPFLLGPAFWDPAWGEAGEAGEEDTGQPVPARETEGASVHSWPLAPLGVCL